MPLIPLDDQTEGGRLNCLMISKNKRIPGLGSKLTRIEIKMVYEWLTSGRSSSLTKRL